MTGRMDALMTVRVARSYSRACGHMSADVSMGTLGNCCLRASRARDS